MDYAGRRQLPGRQILFLSTLCFCLSGPGSNWEKDGTFYCPLIQTLGVTQDAKHQPLSLSCAGERRGKTHLEEKYVFFIKKQRQSFLPCLKNAKKFYNTQETQKFAVSTVSKAAPMLSSTIILLISAQKTQTSIFLPTAFKYPQFQQSIRQHLLLKDKKRV